MEMKSLKYLKTFEGYIELEKVDESLKSVISGVLLGLSTLYSNQVDAFFSIRSQLRNSRNLIRSNSETKSYNNSINKMLQELNEMDTKDPILLKVKSLIEKSPNSKEEFNTILILLKDFAKSKGDSNMVITIDRVLGVVDEPHVDEPNDEERNNNLKNIVGELEKMKEKNENNSYSNSDYFVIIVLLILLILSIRNLNKR